MSCTQCGACCRYIKIEKIGITKEEKLFLQAHGCTTGEDFIFFPMPCMHLTDTGKCAIYLQRYSPCRLMIPQGRNCKEAQDLKNIIGVTHG